MTRVVLVRHGETAWNRAGRLQGWAPVPLSARGREQARAVGAAVAARYDVDAVTASDLRRARETAELAAASLGVTAELDEAWRERHLGVLEGLAAEAIDERHPAYSLSRAGAGAIDARPDGGESLADLRERVLDAWHRLVGRAGPEETHLVVTHGGPLYLLLGELTGRPVVESVLEHRQANGAVNEVLVDDGEAEVVLENETALWRETPPDEEDRA